MGKVWFEGDRTLAQQFTGLGLLWERVPGKSVLDIGCAEGHIAMECERRGAESVIGIDIRQEAVDEANRRARNMAATFLCADANEWEPCTSDIVLLLAVLHKLRDPGERFRVFLRHCRELAVVRLRHCDYPMLSDRRSGLVPVNMDVAARDEGFTLVHEDLGPVDNDRPPEFTGYFERGVKW